LIRKVFLIVLFSPVLNVFAQESGSQLYLDEAKNMRFDAGLPILSYMLIPAFTPEMKFNIAGGVLLSFKTKRNNQYLSHSTLPFLINVSPKGNFSGSGKLTSFWSDDKLMLTFDISYLNRDDNYWGIGLEDAQSVIKGDLTTAYHQKYFNFNPAFYAKILDNLYAGLMIRWDRTDASRLSDIMEEDLTIIAQGTTINSAGAGIDVLFDSRMPKTKPLKGMRLGIDAMLFNKFLGGDTDYSLMTMDYRQYQPVIRDGSVLAWNVNANWSAGDVPWTNLPQLGLINNLRGFYSGQYRDRSLVFAQLEYRHTLLKRASSELSRHGFIFWISGGTVFERLNTITGGIVSTGIGYRFEIQPNLNLRIDIGFSNENTGIYLGFGEAF
jgi:outer membrane protein assembly factor BamA